MLRQEAVIQFNQLQVSLHDSSRVNAMIGWIHRLSSVALQPVAWSVVVVLGCCQPAVTQLSWSALYYDAWIYFSAER